MTILTAEQRKEVVDSFILNYLEVGPWKAKKISSASDLQETFWPNLEPSDIRVGHLFERIYPFFMKVERDPLRAAFSAGLAVQLALVDLNSILGAHDIIRVKQELLVQHNNGESRYFAT